MTLRVEFEITARAVQRHKKLPGRSRFKVMYKGEEAAKPLRKTMKKLAQIAHYEKYSDRLGKEIGKCGRGNGGKIADGGAPYDRSRQTYRW